MKPEEEKKHDHQKNNRTGEDIDMLHEKDSDPESGDYGSSSYKDNYDAA
jgi:hypothetical protein